MVLDTLAAFTDAEIGDMFRKYLDEAHKAPKAGAEFGGFTQGAVFGPVNKALALRLELKRRDAPAPAGVQIASYKTVYSVASVAERDQC